MTDQPYRAVLLFGAPGVGKGTQGQSLGNLPGFFHFSMGDAFRSLRTDSELGTTVSRYSSRGELVPDEVTVELFKQSIRSLIDEGRYQPARDLLVLDGAPRSVRQVDLLRDVIDVRRVVHLFCTSDAARAELVDRLRRRAARQNRTDDAKEDVIRRRFEVYRAETQPVLDQYPMDIVVEVDPLGTPDEVLSRVLEVVMPVRQNAAK